MLRTTGKKKTKFLVSALLALLTALTLVLPVAFAAQTEKTMATVAFVDGTLEWVPPVLGGEDGDGMNLNFGEQPLPAGAIEYHSINGPHLLRVDDSRDKSTDWQITAELTSFVNQWDSLNTFDGTISLALPATTPAPGPNVKDPIYIFSNDAPTDIMFGPAALGRGEYKTTWESDNTRLIISQPESLKLTLAPYQAEITWTLIVQP